jgi:hypothetical protein
MMMMNIRDGKFLDIIHFKMLRRDLCVKIRTYRETYRSVEVRWKL